MEPESPIRLFREKKKRSAKRKLKASSLSPEKPLPIPKNHADLKRILPLYQAFLQNEFVMSVRKDSYITIRPKGKKASEEGIFVEIRIEYKYSLEKWNTWDHTEFSVWNREIREWKPFPSPEQALKYAQNRLVFLGYQKP